MRKLALATTAVVAVSLQAGLPVSAAAPGTESGASPAAVAGAAAKKKKKSKSTDVHLVNRGWIKRANGSMADPDAVVTLTVKRNAKGEPAAIADFKLANVDTSCVKRAADGEQWEVTPGGPEVTANLGRFKVKKRVAPSTGDRSSIDYAMDEVLTIAGVQHRVLLVIEEKHAPKAQLIVNRVRLTDGECTLSTSYTILKPKR
jgi:hypothetical protein